MRLLDRPSLRGAAVALLIGAGLLVPAAAPSPVAAVGPLPDCRIDDILTVPRGYDDWSITLVDWILSVGPDYKPPDLVSVLDAGVGGGGLIRTVAIADLKAMAAAARKNGTPLVAWSPYRSYKQQVKLFNGYSSGYGYDRAITFSARPGHSENQLGVTIDFVSVSDDGLTSNWEVTRTGRWMATHAWEYGWLMSYPKGKSEVTCYDYEPWHYRYVGRDLARKIHDSGLTIREYLWTNFTRVDPETGLPLASATVTPSTGPSPDTSPAAGTSDTPNTPSAAASLPAGDQAASTSPALATILGMSPITAIGLLVVLGSIAVLGSLVLRRRSLRRLGQRGVR